MHAASIIAQKSMGLRIETYERLRRERRATESFSDTIERLLKGARPSARVRDFFGMLSADEAALAVEVRAARSTWERRDPWEDAT